MVLTKMKETAEAYLGEKVTHAVVTVPACECCMYHWKFNYRTMSQTSTTPNVRQPKMLGLLLAFRFFVSSTSLLPLPLPMVLTRRTVNLKSSSTTLVVVPLMSRFSPSRTVSLRSLRPPVTLTLVVKISTTGSLTTLSNFTRRRRVLMSPPTCAPWAS